MGGDGGAAEGAVDDRCQSVARLQMARDEFGRRGLEQLEGVGGEPELTAARFDRAVEAVEPGREVGVARGTDRAEQLVERHVGERRRHADDVVGLLGAAAEHHDRAVRLRDRHGEVVRPAVVVVPLVGLDERRRRQHDREDREAGGDTDREELQRHEGHRDRQREQVGAVLRPRAVEHQQHQREVGNGRDQHGDGRPAGPRDAHRGEQHERQGCEREEPFLEQHGRDVAGPGLAPRPAEDERDEPRSLLAAVAKERCDDDGDRRVGGGDRGQTQGAAPRVAVPTGEVQHEDDRSEQVAGGVHRAGERGREPDGHGARDRRSAFEPGPHDERERGEAEEQAVHLGDRREVGDRGGGGDEQCCGSRRAPMEAEEHGGPVREADAHARAQRGCDGEPLVEPEAEQFVQRRRDRAGEPQVEQVVAVAVVAARERGRELMHVETVEGLAAEQDVQHAGEAPDPGRLERRPGRQRITTRAGQPVGDLRLAHPRDRIPSLRARAAATVPVNPPTTIVNGTQNASWARAARPMVSARSNSNPGGPNLV